MGLFFSLPFFYEWPWLHKVNYRSFYRQKNYKYLCLKVLYINLSHTLMRIFFLLFIIYHFIYKSFIFWFVKMTFFFSSLSFSSSLCFSSLHTNAVTSVIRGWRFTDTWRSIKKNTSCPRNTFTIGDKSLDVCSWIGGRDSSPPPTASPHSYRNWNITEADRIFFFLRIKPWGWGLQFGPCVMFFFHEPGISYWKFVL